MKIAHLTSIAFLTVLVSGVHAENIPAETTRVALIMGTGGCFFGRVSLQKNPTREVLIQDHIFCTNYTRNQNMFARLVPSDQASVLATLDGQRDLLVERELKNRK